MRSEKIFNAMEHLENKYIAEALEEYGSAKDIELEEEDPIDPYTEAVLFYAEDNVSFKHGRFIKWAGLAAGVCAVTAGVIIMGKSGLFSGVFSLPNGMGKSETSDTVISFEEPEVKIYNLNKIKENFDLEELEITDSDLMDQMRLGSVVSDGDKLYFAKKLWNEDKNVVCAYDIKENICETLFEVKDTYISSRDLTVLCVYGGSLYYEDIDDYYYNDMDRNVSANHTCICKYDFFTKTTQEIFSLPITTHRRTDEDTRDKTGEQYLGAIKAAEGYLFFENGEYINEKNEKSKNISRYDMASGETVTFKENAKLFGVQGDKLLFIPYEESADTWQLTGCNVENGEEETLSVFPNEIDYGSVCFNGKNVWVAQHFKASYDTDVNQNRFGFEIRRLNENKELETIVKVYDLSAHIKNVHDLIISDRIIFDTKSGECIIAGNHVLLCEAGGELYCLDYSGSQTKVWRFNLSETS